MIYSDVRDYGWILLIFMLFRMEIEIGGVMCVAEREICDVWWRNGFRRGRRGLLEAAGASGGSTVSHSVSEGNLAGGASQAYDVC